MAEAGKIYSDYTRIEIDENGIIWLIQNHFENPSIITEMECSSRGHCVIDDGWIEDEEEYDIFE